MDHRAAEFPTTDAKLNNFSNDAGILTSGGGDQ
jgi:hypothetical protein